MHHELKWVWLHHDIILASVWSRRENQGKELSQDNRASVKIRTENHPNTILELHCQARYLGTSSDEFMQQIMI
jgi:hypothetical protein